MTKTNRPRPGKPELTDERVHELIAEARSLVQPSLPQLEVSGIVTTGLLAAAMRREDEAGIAEALMSLLPVMPHSKVAMPSVDDRNMRLIEALVEITQLAAEATALNIKDHDEIVAFLENGGDLDDLNEKSDETQKRAERMEIHNRVHTIAVAQLWALTRNGERNLTQIVSPDFVSRL